MFSFLPCVALWGLVFGDFATGLRLGAFRSEIPRADAPVQTHSTPVDSCRFGLRGPDATSLRVYERGRMYEGLATGSLSRRWDYASERSEAKSHVRMPPRRHTRLLLEILSQIGLTSL